MNVRVGALAEIATINEKGEIVLDTKGAVILNCGIIPNVKIIDQKANNTKSIDEGKVIKPISEIPNVVDMEKEKEEEEKEKQEERKEPEKTRDDGADDMII